MTRSVLSTRAVLAWLLLGVLSVFASAQELPRKGVFGAQLSPPTAEQRSAAKLAEGEGLLIGNVVPDQTAASAGVKTGDILVSFGGKKIGSVQELVAALSSTPANSSIELEVVREGKRQKLTGTVVEKPRDKGETYDVIYGHVVSNGTRVRTVVTKPKAAGRHPVMLLIQGLGPGSVDQPLSGPGVYSQVLSEFAKDDWVTVRVDKPGVGDSEGGPYEQVDFDTENDIYRQALKMAKDLPYADPENLFIFGHSMGGFMGPIIASEIPIRGIAVAGTVIKTWPEYSLENHRRQLLLGGSSYAEIDQYLRSLQAVLTQLFVYKSDPAQLKKDRPELAAMVDDQMPGGLMSGRVLRFWQQLHDKNLPEYWNKVDAHVLAMWGENEFISTEEDHKMIADVINRKNPGKGKYVKLSQSDHGFKRTTSQEDSFRRWAQPGGETNRNVIEELKAWTEAVRKK